MIKDITESKQQQEQINFLAYRDTLTELANRRAFHQYVEQAIARSKISKRPFAVMFLDLDRFKIINDTLGHRVGDLLLIAVAKRLERMTTPNMKLARLAGDEFTILIENYNKRPDVKKMADTIVEAMNEPFEIENQHLQISPSIGLPYILKQVKIHCRFYNMLIWPCMKQKIGAKTVALYTRKNCTKKWNEKLELKKICHLL
ncbi:GGDEF domain-containing protein (plasmid) [Bacillus cereus]|nr:GGDEF domain-containing protein [Bacillus cereus]